MNEANVTGDCGVKKTTATLEISWPKKNPFYQLAMEFEKLGKVAVSDNMTSWMVRMITFTATLENNTDFMNSTVTNNSVASIYNGTTVNTFKGQVGGNYYCREDTDLPLENKEEHFKVDSSFQDMRVEPFVDKKEGYDFSNDTNECYKDHPTATAMPSTEPPGNSDIVPIAVGCALAGLVLIVLIAYVIGRRKSHSGYEKV